MLHGIFLLVFTVSTEAGTSAGQADLAPVVWRLNETAQLGGNSATVLGSPRVVEAVDGQALYFDGIADGLLLPVNPLTGFRQFTIEALIRPAADGPEEQRFLHIQDTAGNRALLEIRLKDGRWALDTFLRSEKTAENRTLLDRQKLHPADRWTWVALVYADGHMAHFIDGVKELAGDIDFPPLLAGKISLGVRQNQVYWFKGGIREVRFHAVALAPAALQRISTPPPEGASGSP